MKIGASNPHNLHTSLDATKGGGWKRDRTSSQTVASSDFVNKTIVIEFVNQAAVDKLFNFDVRRFRIEQSHQPSDVAHSLQVRDRFPLDAGKIVLIPLFPHCRIAYLKPPHHSLITTDLLAGAMLKAK